MESACAKNASELIGLLSFLLSNAIGRRINVTEISLVDGLSYGPRWLSAAFKVVPQFVEETLPSIQAIPTCVLEYGLLDSDEQGGRRVFVTEAEGGMGGFNECRDRGWCGIGWRERVNSFGRSLKGLQREVK